MQHIVEIAFDFDDEKAKKAADTAIENELVQIIKGIITDKLAPMGSGWYSGRIERDWNPFYSRFDEIAREMIDEHKEEIINNASSLLVDSLKRTKAWKEKYGEILNDEG